MKQKGHPRQKEFAKIRNPEGCLNASAASELPKKCQKPYHG
jgi:hypothetical protein